MKDFFAMAADLNSSHLLVVFASSSCSLVMQSWCKVSGVSTLGENFLNLVSKHLLHELCQWFRLCLQLVQMNGGIWDGLLHICWCTRSDLARITVSSLFKGISVNGVIRIKPEHVCLVVIPQRNNQDSTCSESTIHCLKTALCGKLVPSLVSCTQSAHILSDIKLCWLPLSEYLGCSVVQPF